MRHDFSEVEKKLNTMRQGEMSYFHVGKHKDPMLVKKGVPMKGSTLLKDIKSTHTSKAIVDPSLAIGQYVGEPTDETN